MGDYRGRERRREPRVSRQLAVTIEDGQPPVTTRTVNLSRSGVLCELAHPIPVMERVRVILVIPAPEGLTRRVHCTGVVVRQERVPGRGDGPARYQLAIFFTQVRARDRRHLDAYVQQALADPARIT